MQKLIVDVRSAEIDDCDIGDLGTRKQFGESVEGEVDAARQIQKIK